MKTTPEYLNISWQQDQLSIKLEQLIIKSEAKWQQTPFYIRGISSYSQMMNMLSKQLGYSSHKAFNLQQQVLQEAQSQHNMHISSNLCTQHVQVQDKDLQVKSFSSQQLKGS